MKIPNLSICMALTLSCAAWAGDDLGGLSLDELLKTEVTSVSRKVQSLSDVAAAAFVISADDIARSGAISLPDVLRMVPGIAVAQIDASRYAVSSRGFNGRFANKLQVLIDGRSIYHPLFSGVLWESDPVPMADIERIEVIRGPGAAMWGSNAVGGVINIITKHARELQGSALIARAGSQGESGLYARQGVVLPDGGVIKFSIQHRQADGSDTYRSGWPSVDDYKSTVLDARYDLARERGQDLTLWFNATNANTGDAWLSDYSVGPGGLALQPKVMEQNIHSETLTGRYRWLTETGVESSVQVSGGTSGVAILPYVDEKRTTIDLEYQGRFALGAHDLLWGGNYRQSHDRIYAPDFLLGFVKDSFTQRSQGVFVHDEWTLVPDAWKLGLGVRWDGTNRGGNYWSPNAALLWTPTRSDSGWLKVARAPRVPSRAEQDIQMFTSIMPVPIEVSPGVYLPWVLRTVPPSQALTAEKSLTVELGYRKQWTSNLQGDVVVYHQRYTDLRSGTMGMPYYYAYQSYPAMVSDVTECNCMAATMKGLELSADWLALPNWRLQLSATWQNLAADTSTDPVIAAAALREERATARRFASLRSQWNITLKHQLDGWLRASSGYWRSELPYTADVRVPGYVTLDLRYAYQPSKGVEYSVMGRNLIGGKHLENVADYLPSLATVVKPSVHIMGRWAF